ncbi:snare associated Golgi protein-domain-containing protein [Trametes punicea]|nr:snare associated Golgi protein-domain-containing protein [Trametes punicea]
MAPAYPPYAPRSPSSNVSYAGVSTAPTYPYPPHTRYDVSAASLDSDSSSGLGDDDNDHTPKHRNLLPSKEDAGWETARPVTAALDLRAVNRTPSPTPSEAKELSKTSVFDWESILKWSYWLRKEWIWYYVAFIVCLVAVILFTVYHQQIVDWLKPAADWMHDLPFGWTIPIAVLFVISFPPLFGHEIVAILCGLVWGLWIGFGIVAAGTFLGEVGNFYAFKHCCAARGEKLEKTKLQYACLARVVREGGFKIALIARLSAIPGHFTTAVFSTCGMSIWTFCIAAILSLPKQFVTVYLGVALEQSEDGTSNTRDTVIKDIVLGVTTLITIVAMWYIYHKMNQVKSRVIYDRRKARQAKLAMASASGSLPYSSVTNPAVLDSTASVAFNAVASDVEIPLTASYNPYPAGGIGAPSSYQYRDQARRAVYAPQPQRPLAVGEGAYAMGGAVSGPSSQRTSPLPPGAGHAFAYSTTSQIPMQRVSPKPLSGSPPRDPFADSARVEPPPSAPWTQTQAYAQSHQRQAPPRGYGSPPPDAFASRPPNTVSNPSPSHRPSQSHAQRIASPPPPPLRPPPASVPQTPTQATYFQPPPPPVPPVPPVFRTVGGSGGVNVGYADPFSDPYPAAAPAASALPNPYEREMETEGGRTKGGRSAPDATDTTFYTADAGVHSHGPSGVDSEGEGEAYARTAYDGRGEQGPVRGMTGMRTGAGRLSPPAYSAAPP